MRFVVLCKHSILVNAKIYVALAFYHGMFYILIEPSDDEDDSHENITPPVTRRQRGRPHVNYPLYQIGKCQVCPHKERPVFAKEYTH